MPFLNSSPIFIEITGSRQIQDSMDLGSVFLLMEFF
jgi:hypothetical protein